MKQTAVEWLLKQLEKKGDASVNMSIGRMQISIIEEDYINLLDQAKEMEKQQGYNEEDLECAWNSSDQNMRFQFSSSAYKGITFKQWLEKFKEEKQL